MGGSNYPSYSGPWTCNIFLCGGCRLYLLFTKQSPSVSPLANQPRDLPRRLPIDLILDFFFPRASERASEEIGRLSSFGHPLILPAAGLPHYARTTSPSVAFHNNHQKKERTKLFHCLLLSLCLLDFWFLRKKGSFEISHPSDQCWDDSIKVIIHYQLLLQKVI